MPALRLHDIFHYQGRLHRVILVNESRALISPITRTATRLKAADPDGGDPAHSESCSVSANTECDIIARYHPATATIHFLKPSAVPSAVALAKAEAPVPDPEPQTLTQTNLL